MIKPKILPFAFILILAGFMLLCHDTILWPNVFKGLPISTKNTDTKQENSDQQQQDESDQDVYTNSPKAIIRALLEDISKKKKQRQ